MTQKLRDLIDIPVSVAKSDFVISLAQGVRDAAATLGTYVVTDDLEGCFGQALHLIGGAVTKRRSTGAFLDGSFGSGKSHFMAVLHLLLQGDVRARAVPELASVIAQHDPQLQGRSFLLVPIDMLIAPSMEAGVLGGYVSYVRRAHPDAPLPAVYLSDQLLTDAANLRARMGDPAFFASLGGGDSGFGDLDAGWDAESYDRAVAAGPGNDDHERLVASLVDAYFSATIGHTAAGGTGYVGFPEGLAAVSRHAQALGYDAVVLFLDEIILWLATRMADRAFVDREAAKLARLVEPGQDARPIPLVSFLARQRDLRDFLGAGLPGADRSAFSKVLSYQEGRFDTIKLADRNLAAIVERRLLAPRDEAARQTIDAAFDAMAAGAGRALDTLVTSTGDRQAFRRVYPFSPALVDSLVAVSAFLQRERTALRLLLQLLVRQRDTLEVGDLVPVGDLYDVIIEGDPPFAAELKRHFANAQRFYTTRLRPLLLAEHGLGDEQAAHLEPGHPFRTDDRLVKTLLVGALVPGVEPLRALTARRLAELNHGTIATPIPGQERAAVLGRLRRWAATVGELRIDGNEQDPTVSLQLTGVDTRAILDAARDVDSTSARRAKVIGLVSQALGIESGILAASTFPLVWRGSRRTADVRFGNVRDATDLPASEFQAGQGIRVIVDFPFDEPEWSAADDLVRIEQLRDEVPSATICWRPLFLTEAALGRLGDLVVIDHVLAGDNFARYTGELSPQDRAEARQLLQAQASALREQVLATLRQAYGLEPPEEQWVTADIAPADQFPTLLAALPRLRPPVAVSLSDALADLVGQVLAHRYPAHPAFDDQVRLADLRTVLQHVARAVEAPNRRVDVPTADRRAVRKVAGPLRLGETGEAHLALGTHWVDHVRRLVAQRPDAPLTVEAVKGSLDAPEAMGLDDRVANLVVCAVALLDDRVLMSAGRGVDLTVDHLAPGVELRTQRRPDTEQWRVAREHAEAIFGVASTPLVTGAGVARLVDQLRGVAREGGDGAQRLVAALARVPSAFAPSEQWDRRATAEAGSRLLSGLLAEQDDATAVGTLAGTAIPTSAAALGRSIATAQAVAERLDRANWDLLGGVVGLEEAGAEVVERLARVLAADELVSPLVGALDDAERAATSLLTVRQPPPAPTPPAPPWPPPPPPAGLAAEGHRTLRDGDLQATLRALAQADDLVELEVRWRRRSP